jgi:hypothetical protein
MPSAEYFRRQADICLRLSLAASDAEISNRLIMMAGEYKLRAAEADVEAASPTVEPKDRDPLPDRATGSAVVQQQQQQQPQPSGGAMPGPADRQPEKP